MRRLIVTDLNNQTYLKERKIFPRSSSYAYSPLNQVKNHPNQ